MRRFCALALLLLLPLAPLRAADITLSAAVGYVSTEPDSAGRILKQGFWAPVYVQIQNPSTSKSTIGAGTTVIVQMTDSEGMDSEFVQHLPVDVPPGNTVDVTVLARPASANEDIGLSLVDADGHVLARTSSSLRNSHRLISPNNVLYLSLGSTLPALESAMRTLDKKDKPDDDLNTQPYTRSCNCAVIRQVSDLPRRWIGFEGVDVIVLSTSDSQFVHDLLDRTNKDRLDAIRDWVLHGGRLIVSLSASKNVEQRIDLLNRLDIIDVEMQKQPVSWPSLSVVGSWATQKLRLDKALPDLAAEGGHTIDTAWFKIKTGARSRPDVDVRRPGGEGTPDPDAKPLIMNAPYGRGRVMLTAFDLDEPPFTNWVGQEVFWQNIQKGVKFAPQVDDAASKRQNAFAFQDQEYDLATKLQRGLETIDDVPVVSFGWVALFILLYIVIVGPLDYFFLKKVVKRLELTWITFPVIVITISVAAYVVAYLLKGNDVKINKLDVVDVFLEPDQGAASGEGPSNSVAKDALGTTWFTIFSPQIKRYTIGVDLNRGDGKSGKDARDGWVAGNVSEADLYAGDVNPYGMALGTMNRSDNFPDPGQRSGGLFRWPCRYESDQTGVTGVPIQVWQTKSFTASWHSDLANHKQLFSAQLSRNTADQGPELEGWIQSGLPVDLEDTALLYNNTLYELHTLAANQQVTMQAATQNKFLSGIDKWLQQPYMRSDFHAEQGMTLGRMDDSQGQKPPCGYVKAMLFSSDPLNTLSKGRNRYLDESWRLADTRRRQEEAILIGRVAPQNARSEDVTAGVTCPTRLWLDRLPKDGGSRPALPGKLTQDTIVRVFIPVQTRNP
jgi:hypothetical protein